MRYHRTPNGSITRCKTPQACTHTEPIAWDSSEAQEHLPDPWNRSPLDWSLDHLGLTELLLMFRRLQAVADAFRSLGAEGAALAFERGLEHAREDFPLAGWAPSGEAEVRSYVRALLSEKEEAPTTYFRHLMYVLERGQGQHPDPKALWKGPVKLTEGGD